MCRSSTSGTHQVVDINARSVKGYVLTSCPLTQLPPPQPHSPPLPQTDALVSGGFLAAGYNGIHTDDCWPEWSRDPSTHELVANATRFPHGMKALGDYMHAKNVQYALYTAESTETCAGYPASLNYETLDAQTFASWGVDYLKVDGCGSLKDYPKGYKDMGAALAATGRNITYSCSWPAYIGSDEKVKPFTTFIADNCNLWRNWDGGWPLDQESVGVGWTDAPVGGERKLWGQRAVLCGRAATSQGAGSAFHLPTPSSPLSHPHPPPLAPRH